MSALPVRLAKPAPARAPEPNRRARAPEAYRAWMWRAITITAALAVRCARPGALVKARPARARWARIRAVRGRAPLASLLRAIATTAADARTCAKAPIRA